MLRPLTALALALTLTALAVVPAVGEAAPGAPADPQVRADFTLRGSHGFTAEWESSSGGPVVLLVRGPHQANFYAVRKGKTSASGVEAKFGRLGEIALAFEPRKTARLEPPAGCEGEPHLEQEGFFVGSAHFRGEGGFTTIDVARVHGGLEVEPQWRCNRRQAPTRSHRRFARFGHGLALRAAAADQAYLRTRGPGQTVFLANSEVVDTGRTTFSFVGAMQERSEGMVIGREGFIARRAASAAGAAAHFEYDHAAGTARVRPPFPFSGEASFSRGRGASRWRGDLSVALLGHAPLRLAVPGSRARLLRDSPDQPD